MFLRRSCVVEAHKYRHDLRVSHGRGGVSAFLVVDDDWIGFGQDTQKRQADMER